MDGSVVAENELPSFSVGKVGFGRERDHFAAVLALSDLKFSLPAGQRNKFPERRFGR
jgi:ribosomal protein L14E/L6E/L27E